MSKELKMKGSGKISKSILFVMFFKTSLNFLGLEKLVVVDQVSHHL